MTHQTVIAGGVPVGDGEENMFIGHGLRAHPDGDTSSQAPEHVKPRRASSGSVFTLPADQHQVQRLQHHVVAHAEFAQGVGGSRRLLRSGQGQEHVLPHHPIVTELMSQGHRPSDCV